jgi:hypothetical protein
MNCLFHTHWNMTFSEFYGGTVETGWRSSSFISHLVPGSSCYVHVAVSPLYFLHVWNPWVICAVGLTCYKSVEAEDLNYWMLCGYYTGKWHQGSRGSTKTGSSVSFIAAPECGRQMAHGRHQVSIFQCAEFELFQCGSKLYWFQNHCVYSTKEEVFLLFFWGRVLLCIPGWPWTHYVAKVNFKLVILLPLPLWCTTMCGFREQLFWCLVSGRMFWALLWNAPLSYHSLFSSGAPLWGLVAGQFSLWDPCAMCLRNSESGSQC